MVITSLPDGPATTSAMRLQEDGKILVTGRVLRSDRDEVVFLARYGAGGDLDSTFGQGGVVVTNVSPGRGEDARAIVAADGGTVIAGVAQGLGFPFTNQFVLAEFSPSGDLVPGFGTGGIVRTDMPVEPAPFINPLGGAASARAAMPDGALVAGARPSGARRSRPRSGRSPAIDDLVPSSGKGRT